MRTVKLIATTLAVASLGLSAAGPAFAGDLDALLGDWDLNIAKSKFKPSPPMRKYTMKVIDAGAGRLVDYPIADTVTDTLVNPTTWKSVWTGNHLVFERP